MKNLISKSIDLQHGNPEDKRIEILNYFLKTWEIDEKLYTQLKSDEVFYQRGDVLRHILLFYFGHTAVFFINKLMLAKIIDTRINPNFESIFAIGVDEMSWDDLNDKHYAWPTVDEVRDYRNKVKNVIIDVIHNLELKLPIAWTDPFWIIMMGIEHERIHLETSSVLIRQLPLSDVVAGQFGLICSEADEAPENKMISVTGAALVLGKPNDHYLYGWDNEYGTYTEKISDFSASQFLVSNGEFKAFVDAGGYHSQEYWTEEGWNWCCFKEAEMPLFWRKNDTNYSLRLVAEEIDMPWNWPVEINYLEAKAFCNWKSKKESKTFRLPTEAEWVRLMQTQQVSDHFEQSIGQFNINLEQFSSPCPVNLNKSGDFYDLTGNVWQWTETPITGYAGFKVHPLYDDFSTPTFDGKHNIIKGGSWISTGNEATFHARYAFRRHFYQHAGFRLVESAAPLVIHNDEYETDVEVANSCEDNWGDKFTHDVNFSKNLALLALETMKDKTAIRVLDLNADTGRLAFELAQHFKDVTALDFSARYIRIPIQLQENGFVRYIVKDDGELVNYRELLLTDFGLDTNKNNILFMQADANNLKPNYTCYDLIVVPNLLEELVCPIKFLNKIHERLNEGGTLIIASTYQWDINKSNREHWVGGFKKDGEPISSFEGVKSLLNEHFNLQSNPVDLQVSFRKSTRCKEQRLSEVSIWKKK